MLLTEEVKAAALDHSATKVGRVKGHDDNQSPRGYIRPLPPPGVPEHRIFKEGYITLQHALRPQALHLAPSLNTPPGPRMGLSFRERRPRLIYTFPF